MNEIPLSRLTHDIVQSTYKDLHALLDSLGDLPQDDRPEKLMDFILKTRHRFARLLVALRWFMSYSAFHSSAKACKQIADARCLAFANSADNLFEIPSVVRGAAAEPSAVQEAAEILGASAFFSRVPRIIQTAIGLDKSANINDLDSSDSEAENAQNDVTTEAIERLGSSTRYLVSNSLPKGVVVINATAPPNDAAVRIGVPDAWTADVVLDRLMMDSALLILLRFTILVASHPDAIGPSQTSISSDQALVMPREESEPLRQMLEGRMGWAINRSDSNGNKENRMRNALLCLAKAMSFECAGRMAMDYVREQALALVHDPSWISTNMSLSGVGSDTADNVPVQIGYWPMSYLRATLRISLAKENELHESETSILIVRHSPILPVKDAVVRMSLRSLHMESVLLRTFQLRAESELSMLQSFCKSEFPDISTKVVSQGRSSSSLVLRFNGETNALGLGLSYKDGGYFVRSYENVSLALSRADSLAAELQRDLWRGTRYFTGGLNDVQVVLSDLIKKTVCLLSKYASVQSCYAIDAGAIPCWLPGASFVEEPETTNAGKKVIKPPFTAVDRSRPLRFLTLSSSANAHDRVHFPSKMSPIEKARSLPMQVSSTSSGYGFIEGRRPEGVGSAKAKQIRSDAFLMAEWAEIRHATDMRIKRDTILKHLASHRIASVKESDFTLKSTDCSLLDMKTSPIEIEKAVLLLRGNDGWKIQLTLTNNIFDSEEHIGGVVTYFPQTRVLTFSYANVSAASVMLFSLDLTRVRTAAALIQGISSTSKHYSILRKTPAHIELDLKPYNLRLTVGFGKKEIEIEIHPSLPLLRDQLVPLMEELLHGSGRQMGLTLHGLLEDAIPFASALVQSVPDDPRVKLRLSTVLHARISFYLSRDRQVCGLDVDARGRPDHILIFDVSRLAKIRRRDDLVSRHYRDIPFWESLVRGCTERNYGRSDYDGSALNIKASLLTNVLRAVLRTFAEQGTASRSS